MADDDIVQKVKIEVDDEQLQKLGESAEKSFDGLKSATDNASDALGKLGEKADDTNKDLEKLGDKSGDGLRAACGPGRTAFVHVVAATESEMARRDGHTPRTYALRGARQHGDV